MVEGLDLFGLGGLVRHHSVSLSDLGLVSRDLFASRIDCQPRLA